MTKRTKTFIIISSFITALAALTLLGATMFVDSLKTPLPMQLGLGFVALSQLIVQIGLRKAKTKS